MQLGIVLDFFKNLRIRPFNQDNWQFLSALKFCEIPIGNSFCQYGFSVSRPQSVIEIAKVVVVPQLMMHTISFLNVISLKMILYFFTERRGVSGNPTAVGFFLKSLRIH
jgi:hypothetical protein